MKVNQKRDGGEKYGGDLNEPSAKILWSPQLSSLRLRQGHLVLRDDNGPSRTSFHLHIMKALQKAAGQMRVTATSSDSPRGTAPQTLLVTFQKVYIKQWFSSLHMHQNQLEILIKHRLPGSTLRVTDSGGLG